MPSIDPEPEQLAAFAALPAETPLTMLNLLRYRERADYSDRPDQEPCSGRQAYQRYMELAMPLVEDAAGTMVYAGTSYGRVIAPADEEWDDILVISYPEAGPFIAALTSPEYAEITFHRTAALADSRMIGFHGSPSFMSATS